MVVPTGFFCLYKQKDTYERIIKKKKKKKKKSTYDYMKEVRKVWTIDPRTRIVENKKKNNKKRRQERNKIKKDVLG